MNRIKGLINPLVFCTTSRLLPGHLLTPSVRSVLLRPENVQLNKLLFRCQSSLVLLRRCQPGNVHRKNLLVNRILTQVRFLQKDSSSSKGPDPSNSSSGRKDNEDDDDKKKNDEEDTKQLFNRAMRATIISYVIFSLLSLFLPSNTEPDQNLFISWNEFLNTMLSKGEVAQIVVLPEYNLVTIHLHERAVIKGFEANNLIFHMNIPDVENFEVKLRDAEKSLGIRADCAIPVVYERRDDTSWIILLSLIAISLMALMMGKSGQMKMPKATDMFSSLTRAKFTMIDPMGTKGGTNGKGVKFSDVAGLKQPKVEIMEFVSYLKNSDRFKELGAKMPKGVLLLGPPGCGKTMLAKAVATESSVPFLAMAGSEFIEMIGGLGAARVRDLFKEARKRSPCIIYIDEIDAIGRQRSETGGGPMGQTGEEEQTLNQLLVEMDGMSTTDNVILLASTNRADVLDKALLRPGRFDRHIMIDYPTLDERIEIFENHLKPIKLKRDPSVYSKRLAQLTPGFSGADIANVCNESALNAARTKQTQVTGKDLEYAVERVVGGTEKRTTAISPNERKVISYHESGHALVGWLLQHTDALLKVTIVPRTSAVLGFAMTLPSDQKLYTQEQLFDRMCMILGGRVAESVTFNKVSTGAENDLKKVTEMAYKQVEQFGFSPSIGHISFPPRESTKGANPYGDGKRPYSKRLANTMDLEARKLVALAYQETEKILKKNQDKLQILATALLDRETLNYDDVVQLIGPPPFGEKKKVDLTDFAE